MKGEEKVRVAFERNTKALSLKPSLGQGTAITKVRLVEGLTCEIEEGRWKLISDMSEKSGGNDQGPNPGVYGRATLGACLAMGYAMWATKLGIQIDALEVEIQADYDSRGYHGLDNVTPGYNQVRYIVTVESPASEEEIVRWLDTADSYSDFLHVFSRPQDVKRQVKIVQTQK